MKSPKIIVFGYDELLLSSLEFLSLKKMQISAVGFPSNRTDWRANKIREMVAEKGFLVYEQPPRNEISEFVEKISQIKPDLIFVWSYSMILPPEIIRIPEYGCVNIHMGLLPEYRGVNGVRWALLNGEEKTGVTIHFMDSGIDSGDIISRVSFPITDADDILSLMKKSKTAGLYLLENCWQQFAYGKANAIPQDESKAKYYSAKRSVIGTVNWSKPNVEIHNLIRASVAPFSGVCTFWNGHQLVMRKSAPLNNRTKSNTVGMIENIEQDGIEITTGSGNLLVSRIELEGKIVTNLKLQDLGLRVGSLFQNSGSGWQ